MRSLVDIGRHLQETGSPSCGMRVPGLQLVGVFGVREPLVVALLVADIEEDHDAGGHADREAGDVDDRIGLVLGKRPDRDRPIIPPHSCVLFKLSSFGQAARRRSWRMRPSSMLTTRLAKSACAGEWVTMTIVEPSWLSWRSIRITSSPWAVSRLPVGSSARISLGSPTSARATATRCCWPPDNWVGRCLARWAMPTLSSTRSTRALRSAAGSCDRAARARHSRARSVRRPG